ncbi:spore gernimation protein XB [Pueribacillus theae]|uniref:Spore gernimation protein XB n=1 Tax=Pueribacillus theae TaxID=2171751 RepID=A0A2U1K4W9_9BACI|nr:endospore germination permease [Pueribacillus theae]PWA12315.1 spore gernimation protein XB [Pueribacillus theae]
MKSKDTISIFQMILLFMTGIGLKNHVIAVPHLIKTAGRDAWISVVAMSILSLIWGLLILYIYKTMKGQHIRKWLEKNIGKLFTNILIVISGFYLLVMAAVTLKETIMWTNVSYLLSTPPLILTILFILPCMLAALTRLQTITITNFFFLLFVVIFGFFVSFTNMQFKDYSLLLPILENGPLPVVKAMIYQGTGMAELVFLLVLQHKFRSEFRYRHFLISVFILTGLTLGPLIGAIAEFGPTEAAMQRYPAYEEWGLARLGKYVEHVDFFSIYQWLAGAFIRITLILYTLRVLINKKSKKINLWIILSASVIVGTLVAFPIDERVFFNMLMHVLLPLTFWFFLGLSIFFGIIAFMNRRKKRGDNDVQET